MIEFFKAFWGQPSSSPGDGGAEESLFCKRCQGDEFEVLSLVGRLGHTEARNRLNVTRVKVGCVDCMAVYAVRADGKRGLSLEEAAPPTTAAGVVPTRPEYPTAPDRDPGEGNGQPSFDDMDPAAAVDYLERHPEASMKET